MSKHVITVQQIPSAPWYVTATDSYLGRYLERPYTKNVVILPCVDYAEAEAVADYARSRGEMRYVSIRATKPRLQPHVLYSLMCRAEAHAWYPRLPETEAPWIG